jgi:hypothetical protein
MRARSKKEDNTGQYEGHLVSALVISVDQHGLPPFGAT